MTALQAAVAMGSFSLAVLAPQLGITLGQLGLLHTLLFGIGACSSLASGWLIARLGDTRTAACCAAGIALAMLPLAASPALVQGAIPWSMWLAIVLMGLVFGPETPASASVLARVTPAAQRPLVFSIRQTGNQIGAMAGSLLLPWLLLQHGGAAPFLLVAVLALLTAWWCARVPRAAPVPGSDAAAPSPAAPAGATLRTVGATLPLRRLALATCAFSAMQMCLNTFLMSHVVRDWSWPVAAAAALVATLQAGGFAGRLLWGWLARRWNRHRERSALLLGGLGLAMAVCCVVLVLGPSRHAALFAFPLAFLLGLSASGWNGVMVAEVARLAGPQAAGAVTGAVLMFGYSGLALAPLGFAVVEGVLGVAWAFVGLSVGAAWAAGGLLRSARDVLA